MVKTVIDTNCIKYFQEERVADENGTYTEMIGLVFENGGMAIDADGRALHEYQECCRPSALGLNLIDWINDNLTSGKISLHEMDHSLKGKLKELGVPDKDLKWPAIAMGAESKLIVTDDIDLYEPRAKKYKHAAKEIIKLNGGVVSKFLKKKHDIKVSKAEHFVADQGRG